MRTPLYRRALADDLKRWVDDGLISDDQRTAMLSAAGGSSGATNAGRILMGFAAVLFAFAAISFIAANWGALSDGVRLGLVMIALAGSIAASWWTLERGWRVSGEALALVSAGLFGAGVMLVAQAFNIQAHYPRGTLIWAIGAAATGWALGARPPLALAGVLLCVWVIQEYSNTIPIGVLWLYAPTLAGVLALAGALRSGVTTVLALVSLTIWFVASAGVMIDADRVTVMQAISVGGLVALIAAMAFGAARERGFAGAGAASVLAAVAAAVAGFVLQPAAGEVSLDRDWDQPTLLGGILSVVALGATLAMVALRWRAGMDRAPAGAIAAGALGLTAAPVLPALFGSPVAAELALGLAFLLAAAGVAAIGAREDRRGLLAIGVGAFFVEALYVYWRAAGALLSTSAFFLFGALLFAGLALFILRAARRRDAEPPSPASEPLETSDTSETGS